jgi:hypothetical protein
MTIKETKLDFARRTTTFQERIGGSVQRPTQNVGKTSRCYGTGADLDAAQGVQRRTQKLL